MTQNDRIWHGNKGGENRISMGLAMSLSQGAGVQASQKIFLDTLRTPKRCDMWTRSMKNNNQTLHGDQTRCEENFTPSTTNADAQAPCA